jgi:hypothetical protein
MMGCQLMYLVAVQVSLEFISTDSHSGNRDVGSLNQIAGENITFFRARFKEDIELT